MLHSIGKISVTSGNTAVTGHGTRWLTYVWPGAVLQAAGQSVEITDVNGNNSLTLKNAWPGADLAEAPYAIEVPARQWMRCSIDKTAIKADGADAATITDVPSGATCRITGPGGTASEQAVSSGTVTVTASTAGAYSIHITCPGYYTWRALVQAG